MRDVLDLFYVRLKIDNCTVIYNIHFSFNCNNLLYLIKLWINKNPPHTNKAAILLKLC